MKREDIEQAARDVQKEIWRNRESLWPNKRPPLVQMFDVESGARVLGVQVDKLAYLPGYGKTGGRQQIAGFVDREERRIALGYNFKPHIIRFTGAHELGHLVMHDDQQSFRDSPIDGLTRDDEIRPVKEREADHFAACYLMPRKLVLTLFRERFGDRVPFPLTYETAALLRPYDPNSLLMDDVDEISVVLASASKYAGRPFTSLAATFGVSVKTMAIRLVEVGAVRE